MIQKSFVMMKPDAVQRRLMGKILSRFEDKGLKIDSNTVNAIILTP